MTTLSQIAYTMSPTWIQNLLVSAYGYRQYRKRYTGYYTEILKEIREAKQYNSDQLRKLQDEKFHEMVRFCHSNIPYYKNLLNEYGYTPSDFLSTKDLIKLPVLEKETVRNSSKLLQNPAQKPFMIQHTSGSTGSPLRVTVDQHTYQLAMALLVDHEEAHGVPFRRKRATFAGRMIQPIDNNSPPFSRYNLSENQALFSSYHINKGNFPYYNSELEKFSPEEIIGYPSAIYDLAFQYESAGIRPRFKPTVIITNSETLMDWQRPVIERVFNCPVRDYYGTAEYVLFASQCNNESYHINPLIGLVETIDHSGSNIFDQPGDVLATTLTNTCMPLLRYRVGDTAILAKEPCNCNNKYQRFTNILGRVDDVILTKDGKRIGRIDHIFKGLSGIKEAQVIQNDIQSFTIKVVKDKKFNTVDESLLHRNLASRVGSELTIKFEYCDKIPRTKNGKFKSVIGLNQYKGLSI